MSQPKFKTDELIVATVASLERWKNITVETLTERCGFCYLMVEYEAKLRPVFSFCINNICPAQDICNENLDFWSEINQNPRKSFNPGKYKYQQRRIQKNIDWLNDYLKELQQ